MDTLDLQRQGDDDGALAGLSLVEGDATTTMVLWAIDNLSPEQVLGISQTPLPDTTGVPAWMIRQQEFPYLAGTDFTSRLYATAGFGAVDEAWADPPVSTEQILHFRAYTDDEQPIAVEDMGPDLAARGVDVLQATTLGEAMIGIWLDALGMDQTDADAAAAGWGGDRIWAVTASDGAVGVVLRIAWDVTADADQFASAYERVSPALPVFGRLDRVSGTEMIITQASTLALVDLLAAN